MVPYLALVIIAILFLYSAIKILNEYERVVDLPAGPARSAPKGPGLILLISGHSTRWSGSACASSPSTCRRRTSSPRTTSR